MAESVWTLLHKIPSLSQRSGSVLSSQSLLSVVKHEQSLLLIHKVWSVTKRCVDGVEKETIDIPAIMVVCAQLSDE